MQRAFELASLRSGPVLYGDWVFWREDEEDDEEDDEEEDEEKKKKSALRKGVRTLSTASRARQHVAWCRLWELGGCLLGVSGAWACWQDGALPPRAAPFRIRSPTGSRKVNWIGARG